MTPQTIYMEAAARSAALVRYAQNHDRFAALEHVALLEGRDADASLFRRLGRIVMRAWLGEMRARVGGR